MYIPLRWILTVTLVTLALALYQVHTVAVTPAQTVIVGNGSPASCDSNALAAALAQGGAVTFDCGAAPHRIIADTYVIENQVTVDGGNLITLDGEDLRQLFRVDSSARLTLQNITLARGVVAGPGGAIYNAGKLSLDNTTIRNSRTDLSFPSLSRGGAIYNDLGTVDIRDSQILDNMALQEGGGIFNDGSMSIFGSLVRGNLTAGNPGGGIFQSNGALLIQNTAILSNSTPSSLGGGIAIDSGDVVIEGSEILSNTSAAGGGLLVRPALEISSVANAHVTLRDSRIAYNIASVVGGGIESMDDLTLERVDVSYNEAPVGAGLKMANNIEQESALDIRDSTFRYNIASNNAGGLMLQASLHSLVNVTISGNSAANAGGAIYNFNALTLQNVTIAGNRAPFGASLSTTIEAVTTLNNTILADPLDGANCSPLSGLITFGGHNLASDDSCQLTGDDNQQNVVVMLGPLAGNGGSTQTHLPQDGSPAIDQGDDAACPETDQRGVTRPMGDGCDIGAVEVEQTPTATPTPEPTEEPTATPTDTPTDTPTVEPTSTVEPNPDEGPPPLVHAEIENGVSPTIAIQPTHGYMGQNIAVSGQLPEGYSQARIAAALNGQTLGAHIASADAAGSYNFQFEIPIDAPVGAIELCAAVVGAENAEFACAPLQIDAAPLAKISGSLPVQASANTQLSLLNAVGKSLYSTAVQSSGAFAISSIKPGLYQYAVTGVVDKPVKSGWIFAKPATEIDLELDTHISCLFSGGIQGRIEASPARAVYKSVKSGFGAAGSRFQFDPTMPFGIYVSGVPNVVTFDAYPQTNGPVQKVVFEVLDRNYKLIESREVTSPPWRYQFDVGRLSPSRGTAHATIFATPYVNGQSQCPAFHDIELIANPFPKEIFQPNSIVWDGAAGRYRIQAIIPYIPGILPADFQLPPQPIPPLPFLGRFDNRLNTGIQVAGTLDLDGFARISAVRAIAHAYLMNRELLGPNSGITLLEPNLYLPFADIRTIGFPIGPYPLVPDYYLPTPFLTVPVITFFGLIDVTVYGGAGLGGSVTIEGYLQPLRPGLNVVVQATGNAHAELGTGLRLLQGLAEAGATARVDAQLGIPLSLEVLPEQHAKLDACLQMRFSLRAFAEVLYGLASWDDTKEIAKWNGCVNVIEVASIDPESAEQEIDPTPPSLLASPAISVGPDGTQLSAYVENRAADDQPPQIQVLARFKAPGAQQWGEPVALTDPSHSSRSPVVAFVGPEALPMVVWVENTLTASEAAAVGNDINAHLQNQEIAYSIWDGDAWSSPVFLTDDLLGDGLPVLAGSSAGAVLAWTRDTDGDAISRGDQQIAVSLFSPDTKTFGPLALLAGGDEGLNGDVAATYDESVAPPKPYLVWIHDADASLVTADDRRLSVAYLDDSDWVLLNPQPLPPRVDSPAISASAAGLRLAFLVREASSDGTVGLLGTNGVLWSALYHNEEWNAAPVHDADGALIYAERPVLNHLDEETLLLFRRFGQGSDNSSLGQIALSQINADQAPAPPLYITDEPRQNWLPAIDISPLTYEAVILKMAYAPVVNAAATQAISSSQALAAIDATTLSAGGETLHATVDVLSLAVTADPALDPLAVTASSPMPGQPVTVTITVRNVGRNPVDGLTLSLYTGEVGSGTLVTSATPTATLGFNDTFTAQMQMTASGGEEPIHAELTTAGDNSAAVNDRATYLLGRLSTPAMATIVESNEYKDAILVTWSGALDEYVSSYRILRGASADGPFELVGEASVAALTDTLVQRGQNYCYRVQAYNVNSFSDLSPAMCAQLPLRTLFVPLVRR